MTWRPPGYRGGRYLRRPYRGDAAAVARVVGVTGGGEADYRPGVRGSHSSTSQLNWSVFSWLGLARRGCVARDRGVLGGV